MGKGGQKVTVAPVDAASSTEKTVPQEKICSKPMKLAHLHTEELKKWAKAYGVNAEVKREDLLTALVRNCYPTVYKKSSQISAKIFISDEPLFRFFTNNSDIKLSRTLSLMGY